MGVEVQGKDRIGVVLLFTVMASSLALYDFSSWQHQDLVCSTVGGLERLRILRGQSFRLLGIKP